MRHKRQVLFLYVIAFVSVLLVLQNDRVTSASAAAETVQSAQAGESAVNTAEREADQPDAPGVGNEQSAEKGQTDVNKPQGPDETGKPQSGNETEATSQPTESEQTGTVSQPEVKPEPLKPIVNPNQVYTYGIMTADIISLAKRYEGLIEYKSLGKTMYGRDIWAIKLGKGSTTVFLNGSHHAREWMTTTLLMNMLEAYAESYTKNATFAGYNVKNILDQTSIWFVPMVNPDGVTLQQSGLQAFPTQARPLLLKLNKGSDNFSAWKANAAGIDLNRQYPADWENIWANAKSPGPQNHKGSKPLEAIEAQAIAKFTYAIRPEIAVAYHSSGRILYWNFHTKEANLGRDTTIANAISKMTGYSLVKPTSNPSGGGYTDWFIQEFGKPGLTPEIGDYAGENSLSLSAFPKIWEENKAVGLYAAKQGGGLWLEKYPISSIDATIILANAAPLFRNPDEAIPENASIKPQLVRASAKMGDWYRIETWLGDKWIRIANPVLADVAADTTILKLTQKTPIYRFPSAAEVQAAFLAPQDITAFEKWKDWYHIHSWLGDVWIKP